MHKNLGPFKKIQTSPRTILFLSAGGGAGHPSGSLRQSRALTAEGAAAAAVPASPRTTSGYRLGSTGREKPPPSVRKVEAVVVHHQANQSTSFKVISR